MGTFGPGQKNLEGRKLMGISSLCSELISKPIIMKVFLALLGTVLAINCVNADWSGKGILACYGHFETDASFDEGAANGGDASVNCAPAEWGGVMAPEAMFFTEVSSGEEFQIWAWDFHEPNIPTATCNGALWYKKDDLGSGVCTPNINAKTGSWSGCGHAHCYGDIVCNGC